MSRREWWRDAVIYQIYPRSFQDSDGDGIGDLRGLIQRLDYLQWLGVDGAWLSPTFPSPMADFGYDVSDYLGVDPDFGTMATMEDLIAACHERGLRLLLDYVPNHSSDQHPWFFDSRSSRNSPKRDWYVWRDARPDGSLPNNWRSVFGGPAWTLDEGTGQYYLHSFLKEQPDLNWRNPEVEGAMLDVLRFWLRKGIDGFRIDVMGRVLKHPDLPDAPINPKWQPGDETQPRLLNTYNQNYPDVYTAVRKIRAVIDEFDPAVCVAEVFGTPEELAAYYGGSALDGVQLAFNFQLITDKAILNQVEWDAEPLASILEAGLAALPAGAQPCFA
ncbi:MAG: alpha-amylase family glycosyl hydrolase, partial [Dehalococcoidia bacterium]